MSDEQGAFQAAADWLSASPAAAKLANEAKLELYGLFKIVNTGKPDGSRPSFFNPTARAKYDAWTQQAAKYDEADGARGRYIEIAEELGWTRATRASKGMGVSVSRMAGEEDDEAFAPSGIHDAVIANDLARVTDLLRNLDLLEARDEYGNTPLHIAVDRGFDDMTTLLLEKGANRDAKDEDDQTPLDLALITGRKHIADLLQMHD